MRGPERMRPAGPGPCAEMQAARGAMASEWRRLRGGSIVRALPARAELLGRAGVAAGVPYSWLL